MSTETEVKKSSENTDKPYTFVCDGIEYGPYEVAQLRKVLIAHRDEKLEQNDFGAAVTLSHMIIIFSLLCEQIWGSRWKEAACKLHNESDRVEINRQAALTKLGLIVSHQIMDIIPNMTPEQRADYLYGRVLYPSEGDKADSSACRLHVSEQGTSGRETSCSDDDLPDG